MHPADVKNTLDSMVIYCDTREQDTPALRKRLADTGRPVERIALLSGDYSCCCTLPDGTPYSLAEKVAVERKMGADELAQNFTRGRARFIREFERFKELGGKPYLLVENASWEDILAGNYRSLFDPRAFAASIMAWQARYNAHVIFCGAATSGKIIERVLYYELKERLESGEADEHC